MLLAFPAIFALPWSAGAAPSSSGDGASSRNLPALVKALESHYQKTRTLQATFLQRYSEGRSTVRVESGTAYFSRPGRMRWNYEAPEQKLFLVDGNSVWFYVPADRTATRTKLKESADWRTPLALLTGKAKLSRFCRELSFAQEEAAIPGNVVLRCLPRGEKDETTEGNSREPGSGALNPAASQETIHQVLLEVNPAKSQLAAVTVRQSGGVDLEFRFAQWQENIRLPEAMFHFQAPAGVAVVNEPARDPTSSP